MALLGYAVFLLELNAVLTMLRSLEVLPELEGLWSIEDRPATPEVALTRPRGEEE